MAVLSAGVLQSQGWTGGAPSDSIFSASSAAPLRMAAWPSGRAHHATYASGSPHVRWLNVLALGMAVACSPKLHKRGKGTTVRCTLSTRAPPFVPSQHTQSHHQSLNVAAQGSACVAPSLTSSTPGHSLRLEPHRSRDGALYRCVAYVRGPRGELRRGAHVCCEREAVCEKHLRRSMPEGSAFERDGAHVGASHEAPHRLALLSEGVLRVQAVVRVASTPRLASAPRCRLPMPWHA